VSLQHERYKKLIVEVEDPTETVTRLRQAIGTNKPLSANPTVIQGSSIQLSDRQLAVRATRPQWCRCYAVRVVRFVSRLANLLVVVAVAAGGPQWYALESGVWVPSAARDAINVDALTPPPGPAESRASRDGGRSQFATAWKSVQPHPAVLPTGVILPSLSLSTTLDRKAAPFRSSGATSSSAVRGPPVDL
jgi:hypothetical protein